MATEHMSKHTSYELAVQIRDAAKAKLDEANNVLINDLVPTRLRVNTEFMDFIAGITFSDLNDNHIYLTNYAPQNSNIKLIAEVFQKTVFYPYAKHCDALKVSYIRAENALKELERLEAYIAENSS